MSQHFHLARLDHFSSVDVFGTIVLRLAIDGQPHIHLFNGHRAPLGCVSVNLRNPARVVLG